MEKKIRLEEMLESADTCVCQKCKAVIAEKSLAENFYTCPACGAYNRIPARIRIDYVVDEGSFTEMFGGRIAVDPISFPDYKEKFASAEKKSGENEGVICGVAKINGIKTCIFSMNPEFMMGAMGTVLGDRVTSIFEYATAEKLPVIGFTVSGGARMQEGVLSLMQMAKVSAAVKKHSDTGLLYVVMATDPTMGGITASFAMLGDIILSEPGANIGFAGKRVVEQVTRETLPDFFQSAEFQLKNGFLDDIVERKDLKGYLGKLLELHER